jgi:hypothetical protein
MGWTAMEANSVNQLPPGFELESTGDVPPGFELEKPAPQSMAARAGNAAWNYVSDIPGRIYGAVKGEQDPQYKDIPTFDEEFDVGFNLSDTLAVDFSSDKLKVAAAKERLNKQKAYGAVRRASWTGPNDMGRADMIKKQLGTRYISTFKDKNGYPIIEYMDEYGGIKKMYVNRPGLDSEDIVRTATEAIPYMATGTAVAAGTAAKVGSGLLARAVPQMFGAGAASVAMDKAAESYGSEQGIDATKAIASMVGAGAGEVAITAIRPLLRKITELRMFHGGKLTNKGIRRAKELGLDPATLEKDLQAQFAQEYSRAARPEYAAEKIRRIRDGMPGNTGEITGDINILSRQQAAASGEYGEVARNAIKHQVGSGSAEHNVVGAERAGSYLEHTKHEMNIPMDQPIKDSGEMVNNALKSGHASAKNIESNAWKKVPEIPTYKQDAKAFKKFFRGKLANPDIKAMLANGSNPKVYPETSQALNVLNRFSKATKTVPKSLGGKPTKMPDLKTVRLDLRTLRDRAAVSGNMADLRYTQKTIDLWDDWVAKHADEMGMDNVRTYLKAMDVSREINKEWGTRGLSDPAGKWVKQILSKENVTPESIIRDVLGTSNAAIPRLKRLKELLGKNSMPWYSLKSARLDKAIMKTPTQYHPPNKMADNIDAMLESSTSDTLFTSAERMQLQITASNLRKIQAPFLSKGDTTAELYRILRKRHDNIIRYMLKRKGTHETFQGRTLSGSLFHMGARLVPNTPIVNQGVNTRIQGYAAGRLPLKKNYGPIPSIVGGEYTRKKME